MQWFQQHSLHGVKRDEQKDIVTTELVSEFFKILIENSTVRTM